MTTPPPDRWTAPQPHQEELHTDQTLRPTGFDGYLGQETVKRKIRVSVEAARLRGQPLDHVLLSGPPGLGKTTLAAIIAAELGVHLHTTSGPAIEKKGDLAGVLSGLQRGDVLFIDEVHRLSSVIEENLYPAMEDFTFDILLGEGPHARSVQLPLERFTLIGATTRTGLLTAPLRDRFGIVERLDYYTHDELTRILMQSATVLRMHLDRDAAQAMARRSRGTPRIANRLLRRVRDYMDVEGKERVDLALANWALDELGIDAQGFEWLDRRYLETLCTLFDGGPTGLDTLAAAIGESGHSLEDVHEPYLLQQGYIQRTPRGRVATPRAWDLLGLSRSAGGNPLPSGTLPLLTDES